MKAGMNLQDLLSEVIRQNETKSDYVASTKESVRLVPAEGFKDNLALVLLQEGSNELQRFSISDNCHNQLASRLNVPLKFYRRLLADHTDMVIDNVNKLFEREPATRLVRTLDGVARAFLSDKYRTLDNNQVLEQVLPALVNGDIENVLLSSNVDDNKMHLKVLFTDDSLAQDIGSAPNGGINPLVASATPFVEKDKTRDIIRPGIVISNSETGQGSLSMKGFFFRSYCTNGCVWGTDEAFSFQRNHVGSRLTAQSNFEVFSDDTRRKQDELIIAELSDGMGTMINPERVQAMGNRLREIKSGVEAIDPVSAVDAVVEKLDLKEAERNSVLESFIRDRDYSQWGMVNAVTERANSEDVSYERACELEEIGSKLIQLPAAQWNRIAQTVSVAA